MSQIIKAELESAATAISQIDPSQIVAISKALIKTFKSGGKVIMFGNGGSAADAQHLAAEFAGRYMMDRRPLPAIAITNLSSITAIGNDYSYDDVFVRHVEGLAREGDAVIGISTSGNSKNVLMAIRKAKEMGAVTIGLTGEKGLLKDEVDLALTVPTPQTPHVQEGYLAAGHVICGLVERGLFARKAVFIDRDDTVVKDVPYCSRPEDLVLFPGVGENIRDLNEAGFLVVMLTNQSGVARGYFTEDMLGRIHEKLVKEVALAGGMIDAIYYCPHHPDQGCRCRKPNPGLLERALKDFTIDLLGSYMIGDSEHDVELGRRNGITSFRVTKEYGFSDAVKDILSRKG